MATLLVQEGCYHCPECLQPIKFEQVPEQWATQLDPRGFAIGACDTSRCDRRGIRVKVKLRTIEVEELPPLEENPHATQNPNPVGLDRLLRD